MPPVFIKTVDPVCRHLKTVFSQKYSHRSMLDPGIDRPAEQLFYLFRLCGSRNVPVFRTFCENGIPDASTHGICFISVHLQIFNNFRHFCRQRDLHLFSSFPQNILMISSSRFWQLNIITCLGCLLNHFSADFNLFSS